MPLNWSLHICLLNGSAVTVLIHFALVTLSLTSSHLPQVFFVIAALLLSAFQRPANILEITNLAESLSMALHAPSHSLSDWVQRPDAVTWSNHCNHRQYILWIIFKPFASLSLGNIMESCTDRSWLFQHSLERVLFGCCVLPSLKLMGHILK